MVTVDKNMSYFRQYPQIPPPPPRGLFKNFQAPNLCVSICYLWVIIFYILNKLDIMLKMFNGMLFVICHKITISLFKNVIALSS